MKIIRIPTNPSIRKHPTTTFIIEGFTLTKTRLTIFEEKHDWQHQPPHSIKTRTFTQHTHSQTQETRQNQSDDDLLEFTETPPTDT